MAVAPHDITDLYLAPVVLGIEARIEEFGQLNAEELAYQVALEGDRADTTRKQREIGLLAAVSRFVDTHEWELSMDKRGIRLTHKYHTLVLGLPETFAAYLAGAGEKSD